jgi:hypothetical protein
MGDNFGSRRIFMYPEGGEQSLGRAPKLLTIECPSRSRRPDPMEHVGHEAASASRSSIVALAVLAVNVTQLSEPGRSVPKSSR